MTIQLGNKEEFKQLYLDNYGAMVNFAYSKTNDIELSKEIVQNVFVKFWNNSSNIDIKTSIKSYLFTMVRNSIIDNFRKKERETEYTKSLSENGYVYTDNHEEQDLIELKYHLKKAISTLKEKRRRIFELNKYEGLTYKEIARYLNISERAVEDNIAKAIKEIRNYFSVKKLL